MWQPGIASPDADWLPNRNMAVGRNRDLMRNNGWAAGGIRREVDAVVGSSLRLSYKPDYRALGLSPEWAADFAPGVEALWRTHADDPQRFGDASRHDSIPGLFGLAYRHYAVDGDAVGVVLWLPDRGRWSTTLQVIDPDRLSNPNNIFDQDHLRAGVELDDYGAASAYHFRDKHPYDYPAMTADTQRWERVERETWWGRPQVIHFFDKDRAGQTRGVSRLTPVVEALYMDHKLGRVELQAAVLNAIMAAFIESPLDPEMIADGLSTPEITGYQKMRKALHDERKPMLGGVQISMLAPGEKFTMTQSARPNAAFEPFEAAVLRKVASGMGISYEQLSQDWSKTNYSSARAALVEVWRGFTSRRDEFSQSFCTPYFMAWFEESVDQGWIVLPKNAPPFDEMRAAWCKCKWIGPPRGWVDPTKEAEAAGMRISFGLSTLEQEAAEQGGDWREIADQVTRERKYYAERGTPWPRLPTQGTPELPQAPAQQDDDESKKEKRT